jgi:murein DD-endopeptidase MepM/ murein hydrolase activator NlpD
MRSLPSVVALVVASLLLSPTAAVPTPSGPPDEEPVGVWPLDPEPDVVHGFEPPPDPYAAGHRGADLAGAPGQAVRTALPGTVGFAGSIGGKPVVTVLHGGRRTTYEPVVASVEAGQQVAAGDVLGRLVVTDSHCFPAACLHWGLIVGSGPEEAYADPLSLVGGGPVRLLPLWRDEPATAPGWSPPLEVWRRPLDFLA